MVQVAALIDTRTVGKLSEFSGSAESWSDWSFKATAWFALLNPPLPQDTTVSDLLERARSAPQDIRREQMDPETRSFSEVVYNVLVQVVKGKALGIVRMTPRLNGLEAWRKLHMEYESSSGTRLNALLGGILNPKWSEDRDFMEQLLEWEQLIDDYERQSGRCSTLLCRRRC